MFPLNFRVILTSTATEIFSDEIRSSEIRRTVTNVSARVAGLIRKRDPAHHRSVELLAGILLIQDSVNGSAIDFEDFGRLYFVASRFLEYA